MTKKTRNILIVVGAILVLSAIGHFIDDGNSSNAEQKKAEVPSTSTGKTLYRQDVTKDQAYLISKQLIRAKLQSRYDDVDMPWSSYNAIETGDNEWAISSTAKVKGSSGNKTKIHWAVNLKYLSGDATDLKSYDIIEVQIN